MKKSISLILIIVIIIGSLSGCTGHAVSKTAVVEGAVFSGASDDKIPVTVTFDTGWLTKGNNRTYNPELAQFCALLSADSYFRTKDYEKQRQNRVLFDDFNEADYDFTSFLSVMGFTQVEHYESYLTQEDPTDSNDSVTLTIGHQTVDGKYDVYAIVIRGCFSAQEWRSAYDPGCESAAYGDLTGEHPEWKNKDHFKGADVGATRALAYITDFMEQTGDASLPDCVLLTGHSRGGGIANLLGAYFEKEDDITSYTYTFNPMAVTLSKEANKYDTIFNIFDSGDFFTDTFPFADGGFTRYGKDLTIAAAESDKTRSAAADLKGRDDYLCLPAEASERYALLFAERFPNREMLCDMETVTHRYSSAEDAAAAREECLTLIGAEEGLGLDDLCAVGDITSGADGAYSFTLEYCGAALLRSYAMTLAYGEAAYTAVASLFADDELGCGIASLLFENIDSINGGHLLVNSYVIAGMLK